MANTKVTGDLIAAATITATNIASGGLDSILSGYLTTNTYATESYVTTAVANLVDAAPSTLDTLNELAAALGDDPNFATTVTNALASKVDGTGTANYIPKFIDADTIGNSSASDNGTTFDVSIQGKFTSGSGTRILTLNAPTDGGSLTFETGGTAYADMGSNKGILGTGSATDFYLGTRAGYSLALGTANTARLFLDTSGNVGIGTSSPQQNVHVHNGGTGSQIQFTDSNSGSGLSDGLRVGWNGTYGQVYLFENSYLRFGTNNTERMRITSTGNVGIGTSSPEAKLEIEDNNTAKNVLLKVTADNQDLVGIVVGNDSVTGGTTDTNGLRQYVLNNGVAEIQNKFNGGAGSLALNSNGGNVGIGTSSPAQPLHVKNSASSACRFLLENTGSSSVDSTQVWSQNNDLVFNSGGSERLRIDSTGNVGIGKVPQSDSTFTTLELEGITLLNTSTDLNLAKNAYYNAGWKYQSTNAATLYNTSQGVHAFYSAPSGTAGTAVTWSEKMRIDSNGHVGIGHASLGVRLDVNSGATNQVAVFRSTDAGAYVGFADNTTSLDGGVYSYVSIGASGNDMILATNYAEKMRIDSSGRVGIGTSSPATQLHVAGGIRFSSSGADANRWSVYWNGSTGDLIVVNNISDIRAKKDLDYNIKGLETVQKLKPVKFTWKDGMSHSTSVSGRLRQYGFIAQETMEADDYLAWHNQEQDTWGIEQYESFSAVMVKAIQEQQEIINDLKARIETLENN